jgi:hypothetical protein
MRPPEGGSETTQLQVPERWRRSRVDPSGFISRLFGDYLICDELADYFGNGLDCFIFTSSYRASACWYFRWYRQQSVTKILSNSIRYRIWRLPARGTIAFIPQAEFRVADLLFRDDGRTLERYIDRLIEIGGPDHDVGRFARIHDAVLHLVGNINSQRDIGGVLRRCMASGTEQAE